MPLSSMTGFARRSFVAAGERFTWELKTVNSRGLEIRLKLPPGLDALETDVRRLARVSLARGSCFFTLAREASSERRSLRINEEALALVVAMARRLAASDGVAMPSADGLLRLPGVLQEEGNPGYAEETEGRDQDILTELAPALQLLAEARRSEGARLQDVLKQQLSAILSLVDQATELAGEVPELMRARIREQVAALTGEANVLDPERLHQEALLLATRADIREELDRLRSHVNGARDLINSGEAVGRRLEFLAQEFNREANTLCSKAYDRRITGIGMELKSLIDQFREQVQNIE
jgi:uncharacterized protein (TIGR00255 family)